MLEDAISAAEVNLGKAGRYDPVLQEKLSATSRNITDSARQVIGIMESDILTGHSTMPPEDFFTASTSAIDKSYQQIYESLLPATGALIKARIARAENTLLVSVSSALLILLLVVYFSVAIYYAIISSIKALVHSAHTFAEGDLSVRVKLNTRDELSHIGDSFNRMADGFNALLEAHKRGKDLLQSVIENAPVQIFWKDKDSRYLGCNTNFAKGAGYSSPDELAGKTDFEMGWKDYAESYRADDKAVMGSGIPKLDYEEPYTTPDGKLAWAHTSKVPLRDESNQVVGILGIYEDITERKRIEDSLRKLSLAVEQSPNSIVITDLDANIEYVNESFVRTSGYSRADLIGQNPRILHSGKNPKAIYDDLWAHLIRGEVWHGELINRRKDGREYIEKEIISPVRQTDGRVTHYLAVKEDITERKRTEQELIRSRQQAQHYLDIAGVMLVALDVQGRVQMVNRKGCEMLGHSEADILGKNWFDNYLPDPERKKTMGVFTQIIGGNLASTEYHENNILAASGDVLTVAWHNSPLLDESGKINGVLSSGEDITERKRAEQELLEGRERLHAIIETALDAVVQMNDAGIIIGWNAQAEKIFGWPREEAIGRMMSETIVPQQYREAHRQGLKRFLDTGEGAILNSQVEMLGMHRDGHEFPIELAVVPIKTMGRHEFSGFIRDITDRKKAEDLIWKQANFDMLTGLPNRHMFYDRLAQETRKASRTSLTMALLYIDLDRFKEINDTLGHSMGDRLLVETARRISACVRETDTVARLGGDEFIIILTELGEINRIDALTHNILHELAEPFRLGNEVVYLSASIGITMYPHDATGMEDLVKNADQAMYAAKNAGRNRFSYFTQFMQQAAQAKLRLVNDLRGALDAGQFSAYYQPILELATGRIRKAEALIRWRHPVRGLVSPAEFISLAEETGLIVRIGDWMFRETARQLKLWRELYTPELQVSVNMSPVQFQSGSSPCQEWPAYLQERGLPGQSLVIEITEGLLLNEDTGVKDKLLQFHKAGIQISLDDFGTGYSSLSYLQKFDIDYLKIDQSFTRSLEPGSSNMALSKAIIVMAHSLGMEVIAEGVETEAQRALLAAAGCDYGQGYLFSKPVPAEEFEELLKGAVTRGSQAQ